MRRNLAGLIATALFVATSVTFITSLQAQPPGGPPGGPGGPPGGRPPGGPGMMAAPIDSFVSERDSLVKEILSDLGPKASMPAESVFIDDLQRNVIAARESGLHAIQFTSPGQCRAELRAYLPHVKI